MSEAKPQPYKVRAVHVVAKGAAVLVREYTLDPGEAGTEVAQRAQRDAGAAALRVAQQRRRVGRTRDADVDGDRRRGTRERGAVLDDPRRREAEQRDHVDAQTLLRGEAPLAGE